MLSHDPRETALTLARKKIEEQAEEIGRLKRELARPAVVWSRQADRPPLDAVSPSLRSAGIGKATVASRTAKGEVVTCGGAGRCTKIHEHA